VRGTGFPEAQMRDAVSQLGISFPTIKQWIYKNEDTQRANCGRASSRAPERGGSVAFQDAR